MKTFKIVFFLALIAAIIYVGVLFGMPQFNYRAFKSDVQELMKIVPDNENHLRKLVYDKAVEYNIPVKEEDIYVEETDGRYHVAVSWKVTVDVHGLYSKDYAFSVDTDAN